ncbi:unnamed protein product [Urochloa decumbens]|uniref:Cytochrome P450 n=1 Tax=Urochloa decumbens TaxID=240449 RepID=A0ABC9DS11_9POAL
MGNGVYYYLLALLPLLHFLLKFWKTSFGSRSHGLRLPPGPWQLPVIGSLHHLRSSLPHHALRDLSLRHGPLMFLKFGEVPVVVASTPDAAKEFMKTHDSIFSTRPLSLIMKIIKDGQGIAFAPYGDHWRQARKICNMELLSSKRVQSFRPAREEEATRLVQTISSAATPHVNLSKLVAVYVADASMHAIMGRRFKDRDTLLDFVDEAVRLAGGFSPAELFPSSLLVRVLSRATRKAEEHRQSLSTFMDGVIHDHLERRSHEEGTPQEDLIDVLLRIKQEGNSQIPLTMGIIKTVIFDLIAGGIETATTTLQWAMAELMRNNPAIMSKAQAEVRRVYMGQMKVTEERLSELSYLQLIIKETLRLHVPGPLLMPRECQEQCQVLGYDVPKGTMVLVNAWAICRNPDYWDEPETFNPERFLGGETRDFKGNHFEFTPFGAGRRICPGMVFGLANIELGLANLLFHFDWSLPEGTIPSELDMTETIGITARRKADLLLSATLRIPLPSY